MFITVIQYINGVKSDMELDSFRNLFYDGIWYGRRHVRFDLCSLIGRNDKVTHGLIGCLYNLRIMMS
jgi:hypothetical protein